MSFSPLITFCFRYIDITFRYRHYFRCYADVIDAAHECRHYLITDISLDYCHALIFLMMPPAAVFRRRFDGR